MEPVERASIARTVLGSLCVASLACAPNAARVPAPPPTSSATPGGHPSEPPRPQCDAASFRERLFRAVALALEGTAVDPERQATLAALRSPRSGEIDVRRELTINDLNLLHATLDAGQRGRLAAELRRVPSADAACGVTAPDREATASFADAWLRDVFDAREHPSILDAFER